MELKASMGMEVSEYEFKSSYSCSSTGWIRREESGLESREDSCWEGITKKEIDSQTILMYSHTSHANNTRPILRTIGS